jgi:hypothetical protein
VTKLRGIGAVIVVLAGANGETTISLGDVGGNRNGRTIQLVDKEVKAAREC